MAQPLADLEDQPSSASLPTGEELATRLFSVVMLGICAVILMMAVFGDWSS